MVVAGPPCQPFSTAGRHRGLEDPRSKALLNVARLIHYLQHTQPHGVSYVIENVPGTDKHPEVKHMLGDPVLWLDAPPCGSGAHRETLFWLNLAPTRRIQDAFNALPVPERCINDRLSEARMTTWRSQPRNSHPPQPTFGKKSHRLPPHIALPKFVCYKGSHAFRIKRGIPGQGMLYHDDTLCEPDSKIRELLLGFVPGDIATPELSEAQRHHLLGQCIDINLFSWFINCAAPTNAPPPARKSARNNQRPPLSQYQSYPSRSWLQGHSPLTDNVPDPSPSPLLPRR